MEAPVASAHKKEAHFSVFRELGSGQDMRRRNGRELSGVKRERQGGGRPVWGLKLLYCGFRRNGRGQILEKERRGFLAALVKGWKI